MKQRNTVAVLAGVGGAAILAGAAVAWRQRAARIAREAPAVVDHVDLTRYMGTWYEIARLPVHYERGCRQVTAQYTLRDDGRVEVVNTCHCRPDDKHPKTARGLAKVVDPETQAKLKVTFFRPFAGDYWIVDLDDDYTYAVVSEPRRRALWILHRAPQMPEEQYQEVVTRLRDRGFPVERLQRTPQ